MWTKLWFLKLESVRPKNWYGLDLSRCQIASAVSLLYRTMHCTTLYRLKRLASHRVNWGTLCGYCFPELIKICLTRIPLPRSLEACYVTSRRYCIFMISKRDGRLLYIFPPRNSNFFLSMQASDHKHENLLACHKFYCPWASGESVNTRLLLCFFGFVDPTKQFLFGNWCYMDNFCTICVLVLYICYYELMVMAWKWVV